MKSFRNIKSREGKFGRKCSRKIYDYIKKHPKKYPDNLEGLMSICGLQCDFESVKIYQKFHAFLLRHRKYTDEMFEILIIDGWFDKYKKDGVGDADIYQRFVDTCLSWEIIPLYCDVDGKYKLIDLHSFLLIKKERLIAASVEIKHKTDAYKSMEQILPDTIHTEIEMLKESPNVKKLIDARNEVNELLGEGK